MYTILFTNGKIINIDAEEAEWCEKSRTVRFTEGLSFVARFNMDNIAGYADTDYMKESEE